MSNPCNMADKDMLMQSLKDKLLDPDRKTVKCSFTIHAVRRVQNGLQLHLALKFEYNPDIISPLFGGETPTVNFVRKYGQKCHIIPYIIINSVEEVPVSWTWEKKGDLVTERIETMTTLTYVEYKMYFPFELEVLPIKIVMDGTKSSSLVNLEPAQRRAFRYGLLSPTTSEVKINDKEKDFVCRTFAREEKGNPAIKIATCIYAAFAIEVDWWRIIENSVKYVGISSLLLLVTPFLAVMDVGNAMGSGLAVILAQVGLLYVMPDNSDFTATEQIIVLHLLYVLMCTLYWAFVKAEVAAGAAQESVCSQGVVLADGAASALAGADTANLRGAFWTLCSIASILILASVLWMANGAKRCRELRTSIWESLNFRIANDMDVGLMLEVDKYL